MDKRIALVKAGTGEIQDMVVQPGTTSADVVRAAGLPDNYVLTPTGGHPFLAASESVHSVVDDGQKLFALLPAKVG